MSRRRRSTALYLVPAILAILVLAWGAGPGGWLEGEREHAIRGARVMRGDLRIGATVRGNLEAKSSASLKSEIEGQSTVLYLVEEGTIVEQGDLVAELDVSELVDKKVAQEISVQTASASYTKDREQYEIQLIQNDSDIAGARQAVEFARIDLEKYIEGEWPQEQQAAEEAILLAQEKMARAEDKLRWTEDLSERGFVQRSELEGDQFAFEAARIEWEQAKRDKDLKVIYEHPRRLAELEAAVEEKARDLLRVEKQARARLADYEAARDSSKARLHLELEKLAKLEAQIAKGRILAPVAGVVAYSRADRRRDEPMQEGATVYERQEIATIPRQGDMIVTASLHETVLDRIEVGQPCRVTIDALPGRAFQGRVTFVALLPDSGSWWANPNQRVYRAEVSLEHTTGEMRPGMSCALDILSRRLEDVLHVPVQAVFLDGSTPVCFVRGATAVERRPVETGLDDSKWVEIRSGLQEGELVLLAPPEDFRASERRKDREAQGETSEPGGSVAVERERETAEQEPPDPPAESPVDRPRSEAPAAQGAASSAGAGPAPGDAE